MSFEFWWLSRLTMGKVYWIHWLLIVGRKEGCDDPLEEGGRFALTSVRGDAPFYKGL